MKSFKKLAVLSMSLLFAFGMGALTACSGDGSSASSDTSVSAPASESSSESKTYTYYEFVVLDANGNKANGYKVQLCTADNSNCYNPVDVVDGVCVYNAIPNNVLGEYVVHVLNASYSQVALKEEVTTSADAFGEYTLQLAE